MMLIDCDISKEIAKTTKMKYPEMERLFLMDEDEADQWEMILRNEIEKDYGKEIARIVVWYLPLYLEHEAISEYLSRPDSETYGTTIPEVISINHIIFSTQKSLGGMPTQQVEKIKQIILDYQIQYGIERIRLLNGQQIESKL